MGEGERRDFYKRARIVCLAIPYGRVASYGQIALLCGKPKNARQVGYALNRGRLGEGIPAHRVVNARGVLSGAAAFETGDGRERNRQKRLLEREEVPVEWTEDGWRVDLGRYGWKNTMDQALRFREIFEEQNI